MAPIVVHSCGSAAVEIVYKYCKLRANKVSISNKTPGKNCKDPFVTLDNGIVVRGLLTTIKAIVRFSERDEIVESSLMGQDPLEEAEVEQWLEYCLTQITPCLNETAEIKDILRLLNLYIVDRVYFVGQHLTVADLLLFSTLCDVYHTLTFQEKEKYIHVSRWFQQVQDQSTTDNSAKVQFLRNLLY